MKSTKYTFKTYSDGTVGVFIGANFMCEMPSMAQAKKVFSDGV